MYVKGIKEEVYTLNTWSYISVLFKPIKIGETNTSVFQMKGGKEATQVFLNNII